MATTMINLNCCNPVSNATYTDIRVTHVHY